jgi:hypothetical protein
MTKLSVAFQFHLPYLTRDGQSTSISIATSPQVSVNLIIGLPFITATGMIIDTVDNVVKAVGKPLFTKHPASPVHLHVPISTIEFLLKLTPACPRNT